MHLVTGFSGTNDSRHVLPLDMKHLDLSSLRYTNALVLEYLLGPENSVMEIPYHQDGVSVDSYSLLTMVTQMENMTQVILDVGAQIIELSNVEVARTWLDSMHDETNIRGVLYCNESMNSQYLIAMEILNCSRPHLFQSSFTSV